MQKVTNRKCVLHLASLMGDEIILIRFACEMNQDLTFHKRRNDKEHIEMHFESYVVGWWL